MPTLVHITTVAWSLRFIAGQAAYMQSQGFDVIAMSSPSDWLNDFGREHGLRTIGIEMPRRITPAQDARALWHVAEALHRIAPDIVHAHTPKGGLLGTTAAWIAGVPNRVYHIKGLPFETAEGGMRHLLRATERTSCQLATKVLCVSAGIRQLAIDEGLVPEDKISVVGHGSSNGVDAAMRFNPALRPAGERADVRSGLGIPHDATVVGFVGRLVGDKGVNELAAAWRALRDAHPNACLLLIGPYETRDPVPEATRAQLDADPRVVVVDELVGGIERFYGAMELVALPTYREGLPNAVLEAQAMGLAVVATTIPGCIEAARDGETATLVPVRDAAALARALDGYLANPERRRAHGEAGRRWVLEAFRPESIWEATHAHYRAMLDGPQSA